MLSEGVHPQTSTSSTKQRSASSPSDMLSMARWEILDAEIILNAFWETCICLTACWMCNILNFPHSIWFTSIPVLHQVLRSIWLLPSQLQLLPVLVSGSDHHDTISTKKILTQVILFQQTHWFLSVFCLELFDDVLPQQAPQTRTYWKLQWFGDPPMKKAVQIFWPRFPIPVQWQLRTAQITDLKHRQLPLTFLTSFSPRGGLKVSIMSQNLCFDLHSCYHVLLIFLKW